MRSIPAFVALSLSRLIILCKIDGCCPSCSYNDSIFFTKNISICQQLSGRVDDPPAGSPLTVFQPTVVSPACVQMPRTGPGPADSRTTHDKNVIRHDNSYKNVEQILPWWCVGIDFQHLLILQRRERIKNNAYRPHLR